MTVIEAAALVDKARHRPEQLSGSEAFKLMDALWGLVAHAANGHDIRPLVGGHKTDPEE